MAVSVTPTGSGPSDAWWGSTLSSAAHSTILALGLDAATVVDLGGLRCLPELRARRAVASKRQWRRVQALLVLGLSLEDAWALSARRVSVLEIRDAQNVLMHSGRGVLEDWITRRVPLGVVAVCVGGGITEPDEILSLWRAAGRHRDRAIRLALTSRGEQIARGVCVATVPAASCLHTVCAQGYDMFAARAWLLRLGGIPALTAALVAEERAQIPTAVVEVGTDPPYRLELDGWRLRAGDEDRDGVDGELAAGALGDPNPVWALCRTWHAALVRLHAPSVALPLALRHALPQARRARAAATWWEASR